MLTQSAGPASLLFGSLAVWQFAVCHFSVWQFGKFPPFVDLSREAVSQTVLPHGLGIWRPFDAFFHVFFQKEEPKDVPKVNECSLHIETSEPPLGADRAIVSASHSASRVHTISSHRPGGTRRLRTPWLPSGTIISHRSAAASSPALLWLDARTPSRSSAKARGFALPEFERMATTFPRVGGMSSLLVFLRGCAR